jgi:adenylate cyclase
VQAQEAIQAVREANFKIYPKGEVKLKGLEIPEYFSILYPGDLVGRQELVGSGRAGRTCCVRVESAV